MHAPLPTSVATAPDKPAFIYGELLYPSLMKILSEIDLQPHDTFLDLGSGLGKLVLNVFLRTNLNTVIGIEGDKSRHTTALRYLKKIEADLPSLYEGGRKIILEHGDFLNSNFDRASIIYLCCLDERLLIQIAKKLEKTHQVQHLFSLTPFPLLSRFRFQKTISVECSWDSAQCYYYHAQPDFTSSRPTKLI